jgi:membrane protease YdiL (CAAX protease family)
MSNGWGYIATCILGGIILLLWKKKDFCFKIIWKTGRPLKLGSFFSITAIFISGQLVFQVLAVILEWLLNLLGLSLMDSMEAASASADTLSMFLYMGLFAPVFEEVLFRGLVMRTLEPFGKKFAILASAYLFGIFHGNLIQSPYAFAVGLILGYVAMEHNIGWAMVLHMINNLILGDSLVRLTAGLGAGLSDLIFWIIIIGCGIASVLILIRKRHAVARYFASGRMHPICLKCFFTAPGVLAFTALMVGNMLLILLLPLLS